LHTGQSSFAKEFDMYSAPVLTHLKKHGQLFDAQIAAATGISLDEVRAALAALHAQGEVANCNVTKFEDGQPVHGILCRVSGFYPPAAPGRKPSIKI
jgi:transcription initiation factor IIE alpha subunit